MKPNPISLHLPDLQAFAQDLAKALQQRQGQGVPSPDAAALLELIAQTQRHADWPALRQARQEAMLPDVAQPLPALTDHAQKALQQFDSQGRLLRWPVKQSVQRLVVWAQWTRFDAKRPYTEPEVNAVLMPANLFEDHLTLRRELVNLQLLQRKSDGSEYRKLPARPDEEARAFLGAWRQRFGSAARPAR